MARSGIVIREHGVDEFFANIVQFTDDWPQEKKEAFAKHWRSMENNGAEVAETLFFDGIMNVCVSDDLRRAFSDFGAVE